MEGKPMEDFPQFDPEDAIYMAKIRDILEAFPHKGPPLVPIELLPHVYIGSQRNANDVDQLKSLGINYVLNAAGTRVFDLTKSPYAPEDGIKGFLMIPCEDHDEYQIIRDFPEAHEFLENVKKVGGKCLVHCNLGVNRCGAICASYILVDQRRLLLKTFQYLKDKRTVILCNKAFQHQLIRFARLRELLEPLTSEESLPAKKGNNRTSNGQQNNANGQNYEMNKSRLSNASSYPFDILYPKPKRKPRSDSWDVLTDTSYISDVVDGVINKDEDTSSRIYRTSSEQCLKDNDTKDPHFSDDYKPSTRNGRTPKVDTRPDMYKNGYNRNTPNWMSEMSASVTQLASSPTLKRSAYTSKNTYADDESDWLSRRSASTPSTLAGARHLLRESSKKYMDTMFAISKLYNDASGEKKYDDYDLKYEKGLRSSYSQRKFGDYSSVNSISSMNGSSYRDSDKYSSSQKSVANSSRVTESPRKQTSYLYDSPSMAATKLAELNLSHRQKARQSRKKLSSY